MASATSVSLGDIKRARDAVRDYINLSPCNLSPSLSGRSECKLHLKMENLQRAGAYKIEWMGETRGPEAGGAFADDGGEDIRRSLSSSSSTSNDPVGSIVAL